MDTTSDLDTVVEQAYAEHFGSLRGRLITLTRDPAIAEELAQEAFVRLIVEVRAGRRPDQPGAWLNRVGSNLAHSRGRHLAVVARHDAELAAPAAPSSPESVVMDAENRRLLSEAMVGLTVSDREALVLSAHGYAGNEIARRLGRTDGATRTLLCRARSKVRARMVATGASW